MSVFDPRAGRHVDAAEPSWEVAPSAEGACVDADAVLILTDWPEFRDLDPFALARLVRQPRVLDGRHVIDPVIWRNAGWDVTVLGRPRV
jgi:UDPglucose 6-dehydrogenase